MASNAACPSIRARSTARRAGDSTLPQADNLVTYGFIARTNQTLLMADWNEHGIGFHRGILQPVKEVRSVFSQSPGN